MVEMNDFDVFILCDIHCLKDLADMGPIIKG